MGKGWGPVVVMRALGAGCGGGTDAPIDASPDGHTSGEMDAGTSSGSDSGCNPPPPPIDPSLLPECTIDGCSNARCVPSSLVPDSVRDLLADCDATNKCVPDAYIETSGVILLPSCRSLANAEGRCVSTCLPAVADQLDRLPQDSCADGERCAPCFDPTTGESTGACGIGCDTGPSEPPVMFADCCGGLGSCVPASLVPEADRAQLGADTCTEPDSLCAPASLLDSSARPMTCHSIADAEGRCLPDCLPAVAAQLDRLPVDVCPELNHCVPCYDPITGEDTGACRLNGDMPVDPPTTFERCCGDLGACVPASLVPADQQSQLGSDSCSDTSLLCVPDELSDPTVAPTSCRSVGDVEGRCLPACLPAIAAQADLLPQSTCADAHLCAPCYDPTTGDDTGACRLNGDMPAEPPTTFERCCCDLGSCVPASLVPADQRSQLGQDTCSDSAALCAPDELADPSVTPPTCRSIGDFEGRCLPACLPSIAAQADRLPQSTCADAHLCAPCYDPLTGADTGACRLNGDMPAEPASTFERCCSDAGACVPASLVPADQRSQLGQDTCTDSSALCAPDELSDPTAPPATCNSIAGAEGRCLPACLPAIAAQADQLPRDTCSVNDLCAPCYDPISGADTGACRLNGDMPAEPAYTFPGCCEYGSTARGRCVPPELVPADQRDGLPMDTCASGQLCVPNPFLADPTYTFPSCDAGLLGAGACVPDCMVSSSQRWLLRQRTCAAGELCAPCTDPLTGDSTGACG